MQGQKGHVLVAICWQQTKNEPGTLQNIPGSIVHD